MVYVCHIGMEIAWLACGNWGSTSWRFTPMFYFSDLIFYKEVMRGLHVLQAYHRSCKDMLA